MKYISCSTLIRFPKLSFGLIGTPACATCLDYAVKAKVEHKTPWKRIILWEIHKVKNTLRSTP